MVELQNRHWSEVEHTQFMLPYEAMLILHAFSGQTMTEAEQRTAAERLTDSVGTAIFSVAVDADPDLPRTTWTLKFEALDDRQAITHLSQSVIAAWEEAGNDIEDLEFVEAHLVYGPQLQADRVNSPEADVADAKYHLDELELPALDDFGEPKTIEVRQIFDKSRDEAANM